MRATTHTINEPGFIAHCIQLAQATFSDIMPPRTDPRARAIASGARVQSRTAANGADTEPRWLAAIGDWFYRQQVKEREAYLAQSTDVFDLERRIQQLERRQNY